MLGDPPRGILRDERHRLGWTAFLSTAPPDTGTWVISWTDSSNADSLRLDGADSLSAALARRGADWLVVIDGLVATLEPGEPGMARMAPGGEMQMEGGMLPVATLAARVVVLGAHPAVIRGSGRVSAWRTTGRFRKSSVDDIAESFALQLERALGKHRTRSDRLHPWRNDPNCLGRFRDPLDHPARDREQRSRHLRST